MKRLYWVLALTLTLGCDAAKEAIEAVTMPDLGGAITRERGATFVGDMNNDGADDIAVLYKAPALDASGAPITGQDSVELVILY